jgi:hypothetical protein
MAPKVKGAVAAAALHAASVAQGAKGDSAGTASLATASSATTAATDFPKLASPGGSSASTATKTEQATAALQAATKLPATTPLSGHAAAAGGRPKRALPKPTAQPARTAFAAPRPMFLQSPKKARSELQIFVGIYPCGRAGSIFNGDWPDQSVTCISWKAVGSRPTPEDDHKNQWPLFLRSQDLTEASLLASYRLAAKTSGPPTYQKNLWVCGEQEAVEAALQIFELYVQFRTDKPEYASKTLTVPALVLPIQSWSFPLPAM